MIWHAETELPKGLDLIVLPGGFSYGDYLRCGAMAAQAGGAPPVRGAIRVMFWGALAMAAAAGVGRLLGAHVT